MIKFLTISLWIFSISCQNSARTDNPTDSNTEFAIADSLYSVVEYKKEMSHPFENGEPTDLNVDELKTVEEILERAVDENNQIQKEALQKQNAENPENKWSETGFELETENYYRQYIPIVNEKGEKEVWVNLSCKEFYDENWKKELLLPVEDGGNCYFNVKINLNKKSYRDLRINSQA
ncbi:hypothetical protein [Salinimicrobium sp. WS361]|uniref:hypothetical protein n=1 Tax=Salinimicrobium sp. WS361 TaxID=3425123 RepID=UPI003D6F0288